MFKLMTIDPVAFELGPISVDFEFGPIYFVWYCIIIVCSMILAIYLTINEGEKRGISEDFIVDTAFWTLPISILGARLYYVLFELEFYLNNPGRIFAIWEGGLAIYGGIIAGFLTFYYRSQKEKVPILRSEEHTSELQS